MADNMAQLTLKSDCHTSRQLTKVSLNVKTKKPLSLTHTHTLTAAEKLAKDYMSGIFGVI